MFDIVFQICNLDNFIYSLNMYNWRGWNILLMGMLLSIRHCIRCSLMNIVYILIMMRMRNNF